MAPRPANPTDVLQRSLRAERTTVRVMARVAPACSASPLRTTAACAFHASRHSRRPSGSRRGG